MRVIFITFFVIVFSLYSFSQDEDRFPRDKDGYFLKVTELLQQTNNSRYKQEGADITAAFDETWNYGFFNEGIRDKIFEVSDIMRMRRIPVFPHFADFISCLNGFRKNRMDRQSMALWFDHLILLSYEQKYKPMTDFIEYTRNLQYQNILDKARNRAWYFRHGNYKFEIDSTFVIVFSALDLFCATGNDSTEIRGTKGRYYLNQEYWEGQGGKVFWNRVGLDERRVYAELEAYTINTQQIHFMADSVTFYNKEYFDHPIPGKLEEKISSSPASENSSYPRFESYIKDYYFDNLLKDIDYHGGVSMHGANLLCTGTDDNYAILDFESPGKYNASFKAREFVITPKVVSSSKTVFTVYNNGDSLYHPKLRMKYDLGKKEINLFQASSGYNIPFFDSYHQIDIFAEALYWTLDSGKITFESLRSFNNESKAVFESDNFFSERDYHTLQGLDPINPLILIRDYTERFGTYVIKPQLLADYMKKPEEQAIAMLVMLEGKGFLVYDAERREAIVKERLFDYIDSKAGRNDYDVMQITSQTQMESNAILDMETFDLTINGVPEIFLSDPQKVFIFPSDGRIVMKKNRDFIFTGKVRAGLFEFYSGECSFEYDTFRINLPSVDSIDFLVKKYETDTVEAQDNIIPREKKTDLIKVRSVLEDLNGHILIDRSDNKSGLVSYPEYPIFNSVGNAYVYYDDVKIHEGVYNREDFFYELDPFSIDSLDDFSTDGIQFTGYLASAGIMPILKNPLKVMPDYYLGFHSQTPDTGFALYGNLARFTQKYKLDGDGLTGEGIMDYLTSRSLSNDFYFFPDSMTCHGESFTVEPLLASEEYPAVQVKMVRELFIPDKQTLMVWNTESPFRIFDQAMFDGRIQLSPDQTLGNGSFLFEKAAIESRKFNFRHHQLLSDTSDFFLYTDTTRMQLAFMALGYRANMDFDLRYGNFNSNGISSLLEFPFNRYVCNMDEFRWEMDENEMFLSNQMLTSVPEIQKMSREDLIDVDLAGSEFISVHPDQDSLRFFSLRASYDVDNNIIRAEDVKVIKVADAAIFPGDGKVTILEDAVMETLLGSHIITSTSNKYHHIHDANVNIYSRNSFIGKGFYDYTDVSGNEQLINFSTIAVNDSAGYTYAISRITDTSDFMLSPKFPFQGLVTLRSTEKFLEFNGGFGIMQDCYNRPEEWVRFDTMIDPQDVIIPVHDIIRNTSGEEIDLSLNYSFSRDGLYPAFFERSWSSTDRKVARARGKVRYDYKRDGYLISPDPNAFEKSSIAPYLFFDTRHCTMRSRGMTDLGVDMPYIDLVTYGESEYFMIPDSLKLNLAAGINFFLDFQLLEMMTDELQLANLQGLSLDNPIYQGAMTALVGEEESAKAREEIALYGASRRVPQNMRFTVFLSELKMIWDEESRSYVSSGLLGVSSVGNTPINKYVNGYLQIEMRETAPIMNLYLEINSTTWFFFSYRSNILQTISSSDKYNDLVMTLKPDRRTIKEKDEEEPYEFVISSKRKRIEFLVEMERIAGKK